MYIYVPLSASSGARLFKSEKNTREFCEDAWNPQVFEIKDKKKFNSLYKMARESFVARPLDWAFNRYRMSGGECARV